MKLGKNALRILEHLRKGYWGEHIYTAVEGRAKRGYRGGRGRWCVYGKHDVAGAKELVWKGLADELGERMLTEPDGTWRYEYPIQLKEKA